MSFIPYVENRKELFRACNCGEQHDIKIIRGMFHYAEDNHTADIATGEALIGGEGISMLAGFEKIFLPDSRPVVSGAEFFAIQLLVGITSVTLVYEIEFEEIG